MKKAADSQLTGTGTRLGAAGWQKRFIEALSKMPNVTGACEAARCSRTMAYSTRKHSEIFRKQWEQAIATGIERLEAAVWHRALIGTLKPVWMKDENGKPTKVDEVREPSDVLTIFLLKAHKPNMYRENRDMLNLNAATQTTAPDGTKTQTVFKVQLTAEEYDSI